MSKREPQVDTPSIASAAFTATDKSLHKYQRIRRDTEAEGAERAGVIEGVENLDTELLIHRANIALHRGAAIAESALDLVRCREDQQICLTFCARGAGIVVAT